MINNQVRGYYLKKFKEYLAAKTAMVDHRSVIREVVSSVERSWVYYLILTLAGLIALLGLLTNSVAVVIGAMLISPLMGPIISSGLAFTIGDISLARRAFRTIGTSVLLTILVCALFSAISPLRDPTAEILARVRPNIFDLFVAILSGTVGAIALCTKRNYLITSTGVAIATAVIPPLSVTGYGLGTGQFMLSLGGFLLFFTNFVAIILTSDLVFFILGFRTTHAEGEDGSPRRRLKILATVMVLISIPLVYTLVVDISKVKQKKLVERVLQKHLNRSRQSRLTFFEYRPDQPEPDVSATVNTVTYLDRETQKQIESDLRAALGKRVALNLEQLVVASEKALTPKGDQHPLRPDTPLQIKGKVEQMLQSVRQQLIPLFSPFPLRDLRLEFSGEKGPMTIQATIGRDYPVGDDELLILSRLLEKSLQLPLRLVVSTVPLLPPLTLDEVGGIPPDGRKEMEIISRLPGGPDAYRFVLERSRDRSESERRRVREYLIQTFTISPQRIEMGVVRRNGSQGVTVRIVRSRATGKND